MGDTTSGAFTITLPTALGQSGKEYNLKKIGGTALLTIACTSTQTIDGQATILIAIINDSLLVKSDGVNWRIL